MIIDVIVPAHDSERTIGALVTAIPRPLVRNVYVVDNASRDATARFARQAGAVVVSETRSGYGSACLAGMAVLPDDTDVVVFLVADECDPADVPHLVRPIVDGNADLVVATRAQQPSALRSQERLGNAIASRWLKKRFGLVVTDLGPLRAIRRSSLALLHMTDTQRGWNLEMQIKASQHGLRYAETPATPTTRDGGARSIVRGALGDNTKLVGLLAWYDIGPGGRR